VHYLQTEQHENRFYLCKQNRVPHKAERKSKEKNIRTFFNVKFKTFINLIMHYLHIISMELLFLELQITAYLKAFQNKIINALTSIMKLFFWFYFDRFHKNFEWKIFEDISTLRLITSSFNLHRMSRTCTKVFRVIKKFWVLGLKM